MSSVHRNVSPSTGKNLSDYRVSGLHLPRSFDARDDSPQCGSARAGNDNKSIHVEKPFDVYVEK
jgi:hypothetical protein